MYAYVQFLQDKVKCVVPVEYIKNYHPLDLNDIDPRKVYWVKWNNAPSDCSEEGDQEDEGYYKAQVLLLGESKQDIEERSSTSRIKIPKVLDTSVEDTSSEEDELQVVAKERKERKKIRTAVASSTSSMLKKVLEDKIKKKKESGSLINGNGKRPAGSILLPGPSPKCSDCTGVKKKLSATREKLFNSQEELVQEKKKTTKLVEEVKEYQSLNKRLQEALLAKLGRQATQSPKEKSPAAPSTVKPRPAISVVSPSLPDVAPTSKAAWESGDDSDDGEDLPVYENVDGKIFLGSGIWLPEKKWGIIKKQAKHSLFVKNFAVGIWGSDTLRVRSVDGKACPRYKDREAKPPLTPRKLRVMKARFEDRLRETQCDDSVIRKELFKFNKYLTEKIQDINRKKD